MVVGDHRLLAFAFQVVLLSSWQGVAEAILEGSGSAEEVAALKGDPCHTPLEHESNTSLVYRATGHFNRCGLVRLNQVLHAELLGEIFEAHHNGTIDKEAFRFGAIREKRLQLLLPYKYPFDLVASSLFGSQSLSLLLALSILGEDVALDFITIVLAPEDAVKQDAHRDSPLTGTIAFQIPLLPLTEEFAPLTFCAETHLWDKEQSRKVYQAAPYAMKKKESVQSAVERLLCDEGRKVIGAPMHVGDMIVYDHRAYHWGMANTLGIERPMLYATFKKTKDHPGVQPRSAVRSDQAGEARKKFESAIHKNLEDLMAVFRAHEL